MFTVHPVWAPAIAALWPRLCVRQPASVCSARQQILAQRDQAAERGVKLKLEQHTGQISPDSIDRYGLEKESRRSRMLVRLRKKE